MSSKLDRRTFMMAGAAAGVAVAVGGGIVSPGVVRADPKPIELPPLPYDFKALEPHIDAETMEIHHDRHHKTFVDTLNAKLKDHPDAAALSIEELLANKCAKAPDAIKKVIQNAGGGHHNHALFWTVLGPGAGGEPGGKLADAIKSTFTSFKDFSTKLNDAGKNQFGSGWAWLVKTADGKLEVYSTANQDSPLMEGKTPLFGIDVWEHAYYLKYRNKRADYLTAIWNVINWKEVEKRFDAKTAAIEIRGSDTVVSSGYGSDGKPMTRFLLMRYSCFSRKAAERRKIIAHGVSRGLVAAKR